MQARIPCRATIVISTALAVLTAGASGRQGVGASGPTVVQQPAPAPTGSTEAKPAEPQVSASEGAPAPASEASLAKAKEVLAAINEAVGSAAVADLRSLAVEADTRRVFGDRQISGTLTLRFLFPDTFQRVEELERPDGMPGGTVTLTVNGQESWVEREGGQFSGFRRRGRRTGAGGAGGPGAEYGGASGAPTEGGGRGRAMHGELYRALVGLLPGAASRAGLTVAHVGEAQAPNGQTADVLDVARDGFNARLFVDRQTHLLLMMTYQAPSFRGMRRRRPPERGASEEERRRALEDIRREPQAPGPPPMVESKLFFSEYGDEDGVQVPHRIIRQVGDQVHEEWTITKVELNPDLDPKQFEKKREP